MRIPPKKKKHLESEMGVSRRGETEEEAPVKTQPAAETSLKCRPKHGGKAGKQRKKRYRHGFASPEQP